MDSYIKHTNNISIEELYQMIKDMEEIFYHIEKMNEVLAEKMKNRHPVFISLIKALLISNCHAVKATLQVKETLDKTLDNFLAKTKSKEV